MNYSLIFKHIKMAVLNTYKKVHIVPLAIIIIIVFIDMLVLKEISIKFDSANIGTYLNGLSILSTFFIFSIQGINYKYINKKFKCLKNKKVPFTNRSYDVTEANEIRYTCYSLSFISFGLIFLLYTLLFLNIFSNYIDILFLFTIIYIFNALLFTLSIWNVTSDK